MRGDLFWLNDKQWARIEPHLPTGLTGPDRDNDRRILRGIVDMLQSGARWRDCPPEYGPYTTIYNHAPSTCRKSQGVRSPAARRACYSRFLPSNEGEKSDIIAETLHEISPRQRC
jgi:transposase